jgi:hypothetical protein
MPQVHVLVVCRTSEFPHPSSVVLLYSSLCDFLKYSVCVLQEGSTKKKGRNKEGESSITLAAKWNKE